MLMNVEATEEKRVSTGAIKLISLDFDGTVLVYDDPGGVFHPAVIDLLNELEGAGIQWCANSGREFQDQLTVLDRSRKNGLAHEPVALICSESLVYCRDGDGYAPLEPWNRQALDRLGDCHQRVQERVRPKLEHIRNVYNPVTSMIGDLYTAFLLRDQNGLPEKLAGELGRYLDGLDDVMITRNGGWVAVMHRDLGKGNALREYARNIDMPADYILAIGDHHNDLPMLRRDIARHIGCPGDAIPEVRLAVRKAGGRIADSAGPLGTVEVIQSLVFG